jgi:hypothetical protein
LAGLLFWPVRPEVLKPDRCRIRMRLLLRKRQLRSSGRIGITGAVYIRSNEDGRIISILDGEQVKITWYCRSCLTARETAASHQPVHAAWL